MNIPKVLKVKQDKWKPKFRLLFFIAFLSDTTDLWNLIIAGETCSVLICAFLINPLFEIMSFYSSFGSCLLVIMYISNVVILF